MAALSYERRVGGEERGVKRREGYCACVNPPIVADWFRFSVGSAPRRSLEVFTSEQWNESGHYANKNAYYV